MAMQEKSIFEELAPYAKMIVVPGVTVGNLTYSNQQDLYSTSVFASNGAAPIGSVPANTTVSFFQGALGESAIQQGYAGGTLSLAQTNNKFSKGQAPANQVYIATHAGFVLSQLFSSTDLSSGLVMERLLPSASVDAATGGVCDVFSVAQNFSWDLTIGAGITRTIGTLSEYGMPGVSAATDEGQGATAAPLPVVPAAGGVTTAAQLGSPNADMKRLQVPIVFPPLVKVQITAQNGSPFQLFNALAATNVQIKMVLRGYLMTMPVG